MPDWKPEIRRRLANLRLEPTREAAIVEELAQYLAAGNQSGSAHGIETRVIARFGVIAEERKPAR